MSCSPVSSDHKQSVPSTALSVRLAQIATPRFPQQLPFRLELTVLLLPVLDAKDLQANTDTMAQTLEQRRRNAKFAKEQEARMGKADDQIKKRVKETPKSPISMFWVVLLGFIVFGGLIFEALSRMFGQ